MKISPKFDESELRRWHEAAKGQSPPADVQIVTSDGHRIAAHSHILASASPVLENLVYKPLKYWNSERVIQILGVPSDVVFAFLQFIYSSSTEAREAMKTYGVQLVVLAHKYRIGWLKKECETEVERQLSVESVIDVLQIARLCDSSRLFQSCRGLVVREFDSVQRTDGWRFVRINDPRLELEILRFVEETEQRKKRWRREREDQEMYRQLSEAMDCLEHICVEGCTSVGPHDKAPPCKSKGPCSKFRTCEGLQLLIRHFAACNNAKKSSGTRTAATASCSHCKRMMQLFRLHSSLCDRGDSCRVPLCQ